MIPKIYFYLSVCLLASLVSCVEAETFFANGVSKSSGWFDANKAYTPSLFYNGMRPDDATNDKYFGKSDSNLCWAAVCGNIITYMENQAGKGIAYSSTYTSTTGNTNLDKAIHGVRQYAAFETFVDNFVNAGYTTVLGMSWYTTGSSLSQPGFPLVDGAQQGGFYKDTVGNTDADFLKNVIGTHYQLFDKDYYAGTYIDVGDIMSNKISYADMFRESLNYGPIALSINTRNAESQWDQSHAITCWGYETNDSGAISSLYVVDSDDGLNTLKQIGISQTDDGLLSLSGGENNYPVYDSNGNVLMNGHRGDYNDWYVSEFSSYKNFMQSVPEPSSVLLSLLGLAALIARRERS